VSRRRPQPDELRVEELDVAAWGRRDEWQPSRGLPSGPPMIGPPPGAEPTPERSSAPAGPPETPPPAARGPEPDAPWWRRYANQLVAAAGAFLLLVVVVSVSAGGGDPGAAPTTPPASTVPPSTTEARPVETPAPSSTAPAAPVEGSGDPSGETDTSERTDFRLGLAELPDGFEVTGATLLDASDNLSPFRPPKPTWFAADGATWATGPWLVVLGGDPQVGPWTTFGFRRPPVKYSIGEADARTGESADGIEVTVVQLGTG